MPFVPVGPPQPLAVAGPIAVVAIDAQRRRVFAAGSRSVVVLDADTGKRLATIHLGGVRSIAVEPLGGHVFAGTSDGHIDELDADRASVTRTLAAGGSVDALLYDAQRGRIYASGAGATGIGVFDTATFARVATIALPGLAEAATFAADPITHDLYVAAANHAEIAVVDTVSNSVRTTFPALGERGARSIRFDDVLGQIVVAAANGILDVYDRAGTRRARVTLVPGIGGCDVDIDSHVLACSGPLGITAVQLLHEAAPRMLETVPYPAPVAAAIDTATHDIVAVRSDPDGRAMALQRFSTATPAPHPAASVR